MDLHEHLSAAMHVGGGATADDTDSRHPLNQTRNKARAPCVGGSEWRARARRVAEREWEFDAQVGRVLAVFSPRLPSGWHHELSGQPA